MGLPSYFFVVAHVLNVLFSLFIGAVKVPLVGMRNGKIIFVWVGVGFPTKVVNALPVWPRIWSWLMYVHVLYIFQSLLAVLLAAFLLSNQNQIKTSLFRGTWLAKHQRVVL